MGFECVAISSVSFDEVFHSILAADANIALSIYLHGVWLTIGFRIAAASAA
jgi:hypothetical protein